MSGTTAWSRSHLSSLPDDPAFDVPVIHSDEVAAAVHGYHLWDPWPLRTPDGEVADIGGMRVWMALSAPASLAPGDRHAVARIRVIAEERGSWSDLGYLFPDGESAGSREWAGCALIERESSEVTVWYTTAGVRGEADPSFVQRIFTSRARLEPAPLPRFGDWSSHEEAVRPGEFYRSTDTQLTGEPGFIKAFRDPFFFQDPATGEDALLFTASLRESATGFDGAVGIAQRTNGGGWHSLAPLIHADGVNNELERPHLVVHDGLYYLFFSTQARTFHPAVSGPTGLYGFVAASLDGPWTPLNGSGLVLRNPPEEAYQAYSWLVLDDLTVVSFVDFHSLDGLHPDDVEKSGQWVSHFGGTFAPRLQLTLSGDTARLVK